MNHFLKEFKGCGRKLSFCNWQSAEKKAAQVLAKYGAKQRPYRCPYCGFFHLRSVSEKRKSGTP